MLVFVGFYLGKTSIKNLKLKMLVFVGFYLGLTYNLLHTRNSRTENYYTQKKFSHFFH